MNNDEPIQIIKNKLYFVVSSKVLKDIPNAFYFTIDDDLVYESYHHDFGPLDISKVWKYCKEVKRIVETPEHEGNVFYHQVKNDEEKVANAILLACAFQVVVLGRSPDEAFEPFRGQEIRPFRDASPGVCTYDCTVMDCLRGLQYAMKLGWFSLEGFDFERYEHYCELENGDLCEIIPGKFFAFSSPSDTKTDNQGNVFNSPEEMIPVLKKMGVTTIIRLNAKIYDASKFVNFGFKHCDMIFNDGSTPPLDIVDEFLKQSEQQDQGAIAVHCKAGLGRTGTLIACYAIKHYYFSAAEIIAWIRLCRPGSILGPQQHFLVGLQKQLKNRGKDSKIRKEVEQKLGVDELEKHLKRMSESKGKNMSQDEKKTKQFGEKGQGDRLLKRKSSKYR